MVNFRELNGAVIRMSTFATGGRINIDVVNVEIQGFTNNWQRKEDVKGEIIIDEVLGEGSPLKMDR